MRYFKVKDLDKFQHYKDRSPPWIKFHNSILDNYEIAHLPDALKAQLFLIWLLASRHDNCLPYDPEWIAQRVNATERVDLDSLATIGLIVEIKAKARKTKDNVASKTLAERKQDACLEREAEGEAEGEGEKIERASAPPNIVSIKGKYVFEGQIIKLTQEQYDRWTKAYPHIPDLTACLHTADSYYTENPPRDGKWFFPVSRWLERANAEAKSSGRRAGYGVDWM